MAQRCLRSNCRLVAIRPLVVEQGGAVVATVDQTLTAMVIVFPVSQEAAAREADSPCAPPLGRANSI